MVKLYVARVCSWNGTREAPIARIGPNEWKRESEKQTYHTDMADGCRPILGYRSFHRYSPSSRSCYIPHPSRCADMLKLGIWKKSEMKQDTASPHTPKSKRRKQVKSSCLDIFLRTRRDPCCLPLR